MNLGWTILTIAALEKTNEQIDHIIATTVAKIRQKKDLPSDDGLSRPSIFRRTGIIKRIIKNRASLDTPVNISFLRKNPKYLLLVKREELPALAQKYPSSHQIGRAFPKPSQTASAKTASAASSKPEPATKSVAANLDRAKGGQSKALFIPAVTAKSIMAHSIKIHKPLAITGVMLKEAQRKKIKFTPSAIRRLESFKRAAAQCAKACDKITKAKTKAKSDTNQGSLNLQLIPR